MASSFRDTDLSRSKSVSKIREICPKTCLFAPCLYKTLNFPFFRKLIKSCFGAELPTEKSCFGAELPTKKSCFGAKSSRKIWLI